MSQETSSACGSSRSNLEDSCGQLARDRYFDLIVTGTVCRTGLPGFLIGNTAETILAQVDCSVLTVKPDGFASPITL
ncbi:MAG: universal stress protein [Candidatus Eisenbacteria sp.]|nr:universal stress protein [Candidatus Eisenbacteria bacterium]